MTPNMIYDRTSMFVECHLSKVALSTMPSTSARRSVATASC